MALRALSSSSEVEHHTRSTGPPHSQPTDTAPPSREDPKLSNAPASTAASTASWMSAESVQATTSVAWAPSDDELKIDICVTSLPAQKDRSHVSRAGR